MSDHLAGHDSLAEMIAGHIPVYRKLLQEAIAKAPPASVDMDDAAFFRHELQALDLIEAVCAVEEALRLSPGL